MYIHSIVCVLCLGVSCVGPLACQSSQLASWQLTINFTSLQPLMIPFLLLMSTQIKYTETLLQPPPSLSCQFKFEKETSRLQI